MASSAGSSGRSSSSSSSSSSKSSSSSSGSSGGGSVGGGVGGVGGGGSGGSGSAPRANAAYDGDGKPPPSIPDATTLFKLSNPELMLDHNKKSSWAVVAAVVVFFSVYLGFTAHREGLLDGSSHLAKDYAAEVAHELEVQKVLPDGRLLLRDGSIVRRDAPSAPAGGTSVK